MTAPRTMISFLVGERRFNYRTAAIVIRQGKVLVCREDDDDYVMLPGGRVEMGEATTVALAREVAEEMQTEGRIGRLAFLAENFFEHRGISVHEIGAYYLVDLPADFPFGDGVVRETADEGLRLQFQWVNIEGDALRRINLLPPWLAGKLAALTDTTEYLILHEQR